MPRCLPDIVLRPATFPPVNSSGNTGNRLEPRWGSRRRVIFTHENMSDDVPVVRDLPEDLAYAAARLPARGRARDLHGISPS